MWRTPPSTPIRQFLKSLPKLLWCICVVTFSTGYFFGTINAVQTLFLKDTFHISATDAGLFLACAAVASIIAMAFYPTSVRPTWMSVGANSLLLCAIIIFPFSVHVAMATVFLSLAYACSAYLAAASQMMVDSITHPDVSVRVSGWNIACYSFGTATAGFVAGLMYETYVWLPFVVSSGLILLILGPFIYMIVRHYDDLKHEMNSMLIVIYVAAKWRHKAMAHREQRLKDEEAKRVAAGGAPTPPADPKPVTTLKKDKSTTDPASSTGKQPLPVDPSGVLSTELTSASSIDDSFSQSQTFSTSQDLAMTTLPSMTDSEIATSTSAMLRPPLPSTSEDPALGGSRKTSRREVFQVDDHDDLDHHRVLHPPDEGDYDEHSEEHHRKLGNRKPHYHSDVVQAIGMNDHMGMGLFVRLKSLKTNHYYNNMVKHQAQKHPAQGK